jgi:monovalent cation:H+ antiporter-2, CPA2 family
MNNEIISTLLLDLLLVISAGFFIGLICKKLSLSLIAGYFVVGAFIGKSGLNLVSDNHHELEYLAHAGALLLLFSVGIEFSIKELVRLKKNCLIGGFTQMALVAVPLTFVCKAFGMETNSAILAALSASLSSTVLVFKALSEWGQASTEHGRRGVGILIFQDIALVPLMLIVPLLALGKGAPEMSVWGWLILKSIVFVIGVIITKMVIDKWMISMLYGMRNVELVVLFTLSLLLSSCFSAHILGLPAAIGSLAAGLILSGNKLSKQIDTIVLPFREIFASVFFVSLGVLLQPMVFIQEPFLMIAGLLGMLCLKTFAASIALKLTGLSWRSSLGMGMGLSQLGEFSFLLIASALVSGAISDQNYNRMLFIALGTLIITPQLIKFGLNIIGGLPDQQSTFVPPETINDEVKRALIVGTGPVRRQAASSLDLLGFDICLIDISPINLHDFTIHGFHTVAGDARSKDVLNRADTAHCRLALIGVSNDEVTCEIIKSIKEINSECHLVAYCKYHKNIEKAKEAGANMVFSEEKEAYNGFKQAFEQLHLKD